MSRARSECRWRSWIRQTLYWALSAIGFFALAIIALVEAGFGVASGLLLVLALLSGLFAFRR